MQHPHTIVSSWSPRWCFVAPWSPACTTRWGGVLSSLVLADNHLGWRLSVEVGGLSVHRLGEGKKVLNTLPVLQLSDF